MCFGHIGSETSAIKHKSASYDERNVPISKVHRLEDTHSSRALPVKTLTYVICVSLSPVLKQNLSGLAGSWQVVQVLYLIHGSGKPEEEDATKLEVKFSHR